MDLDKETIDQLFKVLGFTKTLIYVLISSLFLNIGAIALRFYLDKRLRNHDKAIYKRNVINSQAISVQERIYEKLGKLSLCASDEQSLLLKKIKRLQSFVFRKNLYLSKAQQTNINNLLDYFRRVLTDYSNKDVKEETQLFSDYAKEFNKEDN